MNLSATAQVTGRAARLEEATFSLLGAWVPTVPEPAAKALLAEQALHHAWHASLWRKRQPEVHGLAPGDPVEAAVALDRLLEVLAAMAAGTGEGDATLERLTGIHVVLADARRALYAGLQATASPASDGPLLRALALVRPDQERDRLAGLAVLHALVAATDGGPARVEAERRRLGRPAA